MRGAAMHHAWSASRNLSLPGYGRPPTVGLRCLTGVPLPAGHLPGIATRSAGISCPAVSSSLPDDEARESREALQRATDRAPGPESVLFYLVSAVQPGRMSGFGGGFGIRRSENACSAGRLAPIWRTGAAGRVAKGEKVLPEKTVSTKGGVSVNWPRPAAGFAANSLAFWPPTTYSGIGWTNTKHASAMIVTTVAQVLMKLRLIFQ